MRNLGKPKQICIIGSGASGLTAIKCCKEEGLEPVCFEKSDYIGGLWQYDANPKEGACVYKSTIINTSKEMMAFSDFPVPQDFPNFMHNTKVIEYFHLYANKFDLKKHIHFRKEILSCKHSEDFFLTGRWVVKIKDLRNNEVEDQIFDGVMVATGHHAFPHFPKNSFKGLDNFQGEMMHSHDYRTPFSFVDQRVLVIGIGNSGSDIAVETSIHAKSVHLSTRRGSWIFNRLGDKGLPYDFSYTSRFFHSSSLIVSSPTDLDPNSITASLHSNLLTVSSHPTVNDDLPNRIISGRIVVKGDVKEFTSTGVIFEDGTRVNVDVVVFATGYNFSFPFLDSSVLEVHRNHCDLYKNIWLPRQQHSTLAFIGLVQPLGAINPISEIQSRWVTRVFKGLNKLPTNDLMTKDIQKNKKLMMETYYSSQRHTVQVDYIGYMDEIAEQFGVKPQILKLFFTNFSVAMKVIFGPVTPYQYRLYGPGRSEDSIKRILLQDYRVRYPLMTRKLNDQVENKKSLSNHISMLLLFLFISYYFFYNFI